MSRVFSKSQSLIRQYHPTDQQILERKGLEVGRLQCEVCEKRFEQIEIYNGRCNNCLNRIIRKNNDASEDIIIEDNRHKYYSQSQALQKLKIDNPMAPNHAIHITIIIVSLIVGIIGIFSI